MNVKSKPEKPVVNESAGCKIKMKSTIQIC